MVILINRDTRVIVQGITGREGSFHTKLMLDYGTKIVAGVTPGKAGLRVHGVPVYDTVREVVENHGAIDASIIFVPARFVSDAVYEAIDNDIKLIVVITEGTPLYDELKFINYARNRGAIIVGPNTPGVISPGECKLGIMPSQVFAKGSVGIVSRSGTLTYEVARELVKGGLGQSTVVGIGGDPVTGLDFIDVYEMFLKDPDTEAVVLIGEIGGDAEERFARYYAKLRYRKPVVAYIAGRTAPPGKRMGHAGAIISMGMGDYASKRKSLEESGIIVVDKPSDIVPALNKVMRE